VAMSPRLVLTRSTLPFTLSTAVTLVRWKIRAPQGGRPRRWPA